LIYPNFNNFWEAFIILKSFLLQYGVYYLAAISAVASIATVYDKLSAVVHRYRIRERTLLALSAIGGSVAMFVTMILIHHKTRKAKFMAGIPFIIILQLLLLYFILSY